MIKVIKHGKRRFMKCTTCDCEFTYQKEDIIPEYQNRNESDYWVKCPDCGVKMLVSCWRD